jgi:hypothetical protein
MNQSLNMPAAQRPTGTLRNPVTAVQSRFNYRIHDWRRLPGAYVQIRLASCPVRDGRVEMTTEDGSILWLRQGDGEPRRLFEKAEGYEVWAPFGFTPPLDTASRSSSGGLWNGLPQTTAAHESNLSHCPPLQQRERTMTASSDLFMTITVANRADMDREIAEAEQIAIAHALEDGTKGIMVTRHDSRVFTLTLSDEVPYGLTQERSL